MTTSENERVEDIVREALAETAPAARRHTLGRAVVRLGVWFARWLAQASATAEPAERARYRELSDEAHRILHDWLLGERLTDSAEEDERRARAALDLMALGPELVRLASRAVRCLPAGHPLRDDARLRAALEANLARQLTEGEHEGAALSLLEILSHASWSSATRDGELVAQPLELAGDERVAVQARCHTLRSAMLWHRAGLSVRVTAMTATPPILRSERDTSNPRRR